tara:strand:+ start:1981 stop:2421 length:441 start_codon:yes stop_codon:yes gene_type:complete
MKLEDIQELWSSDSVIDDTELDSESIKIPEIHNKYLKIFSDEKLRLVRLDSKSKELRRLKWLYYTGKLDEQTLKNLEWDVFDLDVKKNRHDLEMFLESDRDIIELNDKIEYQKEKINYLETIIKSLSTRGFLIKNSIEWKKFIMGN